MNLNVLMPFFFIVLFSCSTHKEGKRESHDANTITDQKAAIKVAHRSLKTHYGKTYGGWAKPLKVLKYDEEVWIIVTKRKKEKRRAGGAYVVIRKKDGKVLKCQLGK